MYKKSKAQIISDAICGVLMLVSILVFLFVGIFAEIWHPIWIVIPSSGIVCGIISIIVNTYASLKKEGEQSQTQALEETKTEEKKVK